MVFITILSVLLFWNKCAGCGDGCVSCFSSAQICLGCKSGYWDHNGKCERCPVNCEQCKDDKSCLKCKANFWGTGTCNTVCPENCDKSGCDDVTGQCFKCQLGFYGDNCQQMCTLCKDGLCDMRDGQCLNGCTDGYFEDAFIMVNTCRKCSSNCTTYKIQAICLECDKGFYKSSFYTSSNLAVTICNPCLLRCEECNTDAICTVCKPGTYGQVCQYNCTESHCHRCQVADSVEKCTECSIGYTLDGLVCVPITSCSKHCVNGCVENEICLGGCKEGWSGQLCSKQCRSQCQTCDQNNNTLCTKCKGALYASSCNIRCSTNCSKVSSDETCRLQDGFCLNGCTDGQWGDKCDEPCSYGCSPTQCNQVNGSCVACRRSFYGPACENTCSEHCFDDGNTPRICSKLDGICELGCKSGYSGDKCNYITNSSSRETIQSTTETEDNFETKVFIFGIMAGVGICLLIAASIGLVFFIRRRQKSKRNNTLGNIVKTEYENTMFRMKEMPSEGQEKKGSLETNGGDSSEVNDLKTNDTPVKVYERLQVNKYDDRHQYSGMI